MQTSPHDPRDPLPPPPDGRDPLPQKTTPTWEMELLISGATVFSLLQLPELLDSTFYALYPRFGISATAVVMLPYTYLVAATYALILTFVLHLMTRAYWVAVVGLHSVYPQGVEWDKLKMGPAYRQRMQAMFPSPAVAIERADNRASRVFGFGIGFALTLLAPLVVMTALAAFTYAIYELSGRAVEWIVLWIATTTLLFLPFAVAVTLDKRRGATMGERGRARVGRVLDRYMNVGFSSVTSYPMLLFSGRMGQWRGGAILSVAIAVVLGIVFVRMMAREDLLNLSVQDGLPSSRAAAGHLIDPRHYADQRAGRYSLAPQPYIQSEVVTDDYLRLFIPFLAQRDAEGMTQHCPPPAEPPAEQPPAQSNEAATLAALACATRIYAIALDGAPVADLRFDFGTDPELGGRGFVARIDVRDLPRGRHELSITRTPLQPKAGDDPDRAERPSSRPRRIVFWR